MLSQVPRSFIIPLKNKSQIRSGQVVSVFVKGLRQAGRYDIVLNGRTYLIETRESLPVGVMLRGKITSKSNSFFFEFINDQNDAAQSSVVQRFENELLSPVERFMKMLLGQKIIVNQRLVKSFTAFIKQRRISRKSDLATLTEVVRKSVLESISNLEHLLLELFSQSFHERGKMNNQKSDTPQQETDEVILELPKFTETQDSVLPFLNQLSKEKEAWVFVPFRLSRGDHGVSGTIRLYMNFLDKKVKYTQVDFSIRNGRFCIQMKSENPGNLTFVQVDTGVGAAWINGLQSILTKKGYTINVDTTGEKDEFAGHYVDSPLYGIDQTV